MLTGMLGFASLYAITLCTEEFITILGSVFFPVIRVTLECLLIFKQEGSVSKLVVQVQKQLLVIIQLVNAFKNALYPTSSVIRSIQIDSALHNAPLSLLKHSPI